MFCIAFKKESILFCKVSNKSRVSWTCFKVKPNFFIINFYYFFLKTHYSHKLFFNELFFGYLCSKITYALSGYSVLMLWSAFFSELYSEAQMKEANAGIQMLYKGLLESTSKPSSTSIRLRYH